MKVAIVHPWYLVSGGGERVIEAIAAVFPQADIFAMFGTMSMVPVSVRDRKITFSFMNQIPAIGRIYRQLLVLYPSAVESLDLSGYDLVISSAGPAVFGVSISQDALQLCYCHTPWRQWWDEYAERRTSFSGVGKLLYVAVATYVRTWEACAALRVDQFVANSNYVANRISKYYRRDSKVIYPPVSLGHTYIEENPSRKYYLSVGRLSASKRNDLIVEACNRLGRRLLICGEGREAKQLKTIAGPSIELLGKVPDADLPGLYANCRAFLFAADEDFGIAPVEAQSYGRPVIAYGHGGSLETVRVSHPAGLPDTGIFFPQQSVESVMAGILRFEAEEHRFDPIQIRNHASQFSVEAFQRKLLQIISDLGAAHGKLWQLN
jgi:glycosyltransferase involved in cell wall biosynthesis